MTNPRIIWVTKIHDIPLLTLRDVVVYPQMQIALFVGRTPSVKAVNLRKMNLTIKLLVVLCKKISLSEDIDASNLFEYGYGVPCRQYHTT